MKKIFTILAAALFSVSMMADVNWVSFNGEDDQNEANFFTFEGKHNFNTKFTGATYAGIDFTSGLKMESSTTINFTTTVESTVTIVQSTLTDKTNKFDGTELAVADAVAEEGTGYRVYTITDVEAGDHSITRGSGENGLFYISVEFTTAPVSDPVTSVTISGEEACYVGKTITLVANTDVTADAYKWTVNGEEQEGAESKSFAFTPEEEGSFAIICFAKNEHNADWVASDAHVVEATVKEVLTQVDVTESITWEWTKAASVSEIKWTDTTTPAKGETVLLANVDDFNNDENFNSQALLFAGEYPVRGGSYCQGSLLQFRTTVAGSVKVEFSNTGGGDRPERFVAVNGVVNTTVGSNTTDKVESADIPVAAGDVKIEGRFENYDDGAQYLRVYKVTFTKSTETAIDNVEAAQKAQKIIENGQLIIIKNGVKYNAQGVAVK